MGTNTGPGQPDMPDWDLPEVRSVLGLPSGPNLFYNALGDFPPAGRTDALYIDKTNESLYLWDGASYVNVSAGGGGGGPTNFTGHPDTPPSFAGQAGKVLAANVGETALEFVDAPTGSGGDLIDHSDTPASYAGQGGKHLTVNQGETGVEFTDPPSGGGDLIDHTDTPVSYTGNAGKLLAVAGTEDAVEFIDAPPFPDFEVLGGMSSVEVQAAIDAGPVTLRFNASESYNLSGLNINQDTAVIGNGASIRSSNDAQSVFNGGGSGNLYCRDIHLVGFTNARAIASFDVNLAYIATANGIAWDGNAICDVSDSSFTGFRGAGVRISGVGGGADYMRLYSLSDVSCIECFVGIICEEDAQYGTVDNVSLNACGLGAINGAGNWLWANVKINYSSAGILSTTSNSSYHTSTGNPLRGAMSDIQINHVTDGNEFEPITVVVDGNNYTRFGFLWIGDSPAAVSGLAQFQSDFTVFDNNTTNFLVTNLISENSDIDGGNDQGLTIVGHTQIGVVSLIGPVDVVNDYTKAELDNRFVQVGDVEGFIDHADTPSSFVGQAGKVPVVNAGETALEFADAPAGGDPGEASFRVLKETGVINPFEITALPIEDPGTPLLIQMPNLGPLFFKSVTAAPPLGAVVTTYDSSIQLPAEAAGVTAVHFFYYTANGTLNTQNTRPGIAEREKLVVGRVGVNGSALIPGSLYFDPMQSDLGESTKDRLLFDKKHVAGVEIFNPTARQLSAVGRRVFAEGAGHNILPFSGLSNEVIFPDESPVTILYYDPGAVAPTPKVRANTDILQMDFLDGGVTAAANRYLNYTVIMTPGAGYRIVVAVTDYSNMPAALAAIDTETPDLSDFPTDNYSIGTISVKTNGTDLNNPDHYVYTPGGSAAARAYFLQTTSGGIVASSTSLIDNLTTLTPGVGALDARQGSVLASLIPQDLIDLSDTPADYAGSALRSLRVNAGESGVEFFETVEGRVVSVIAFPNLDANIYGEGPLDPAEQGWQFGNNVTEYYANIGAFPGAGTAGINYFANDTQRVYWWDGGAYVFQTSIALTNPREEYASLAAFPSVGVNEVVYFALNNYREYRWNGTGYVLTQMQFTSFFVDPGSGNRVIEVHDQSTQASSYGMFRNTTAANWQDIHDYGMIFGTSRVRMSGFVGRNNYDKCYAGAGVSGGNSPVGTANQAIGFYLRCKESGGVNYTGVRIERLNGGGAGDIILDGQSGRPRVLAGEWLSVYIAIPGTTVPNAWGQGRVYVNGIFTGTADFLPPNSAYYADRIAVSGGSGSAGSTSGTDKTTNWADFGVTIYQEADAFTIPAADTDVNQTMMLFPNSIEKNWEVTLEAAINPGKLDKFSVFCLGNDSNILLKNVLDASGDQEADWLFNGTREQNLYFSSPKEVVFNNTSGGKSVYSSLPVTFKDLPDTPVDYAGSAGKALAVTTNEDGIEFVDSSSGNLIDHNDTPAAYTGSAGKALAVTTNEDGIEFIDPPVGRLIDQTDTPNDYAAQAGKSLVVNSVENAVEFVDLPTGARETGVLNPWAIVGTASESLSTPRQIDIPAMGALYFNLASAVYPFGTTVTTYDSSIQLPAEAAGVTRVHFIYYTDDGLLHSQVDKPGLGERDKLYVARTGVFGVELIPGSLVFSPMISAMDEASKTALRFDKKYTAGVAITDPVLRHLRATTRRVFAEGIGFTVFPFPGAIHDVSYNNEDSIEILYWDQGTHSVRDENIVLQMDYLQTGATAAADRWLNYSLLMTPRGLYRIVVGHQSYGSMSLARNGIDAELVDFTDFPVDNYSIATISVKTNGTDLNDPDHFYVSPPGQVARSYFLHDFSQ